MTTTEEFAARIAGTIDGASVAILLSIGHQTALFDTMADLPPATSTQIADAAGLNERYVREWLGGMTAAEIVAYDPAAQMYSLSREHAAVLIRAAGPNNLARVAQFIPLLAEVEQKVIGSFHAGGGLSYSDYPRFHTLMAEMSNEVFDAALVDVVLPLADGLSDRLREGVDVADIGCGSGHAINVLGTAEAARLGLGNASFVVRDVAELGLDGDGLGTVWGRQLATAMLEDIGFRDVQVSEIESDPFNDYYFARK
jgi:winged helix-turn-helix protein